MTAPIDSSRDVVAFWREAGAEAWFAHDEDFDRRFGERFLDLHHAAARRELDAWRERAESALALLILLDQLPRNVFRGSAHMFATDPLARDVAVEMLCRGFDQQIDPALRMFCYLPFMHSEAMADQERSVALFTALGGVGVKHAHVHLDIVRRFGRFPHRNRALGRATTAEEQAFLDAGGFAG
jgi:uncharacterized protein (DUF924 family)